MADLAQRTVRRKLDRARPSRSTGALREHQRFLLAMQLRRLEEIGRDLTAVDARIDAPARPFAAQQALLVTIPGVDALTAAAIVAEIGTDMAVFGTAQRLAAWAGLCPANHESAGKQKRCGTRKGDPYLKTTLVTAAVCAARTNGTYCATSSTGCGRAWVRRRRPWPSRTRSCSPCSTCCNAPSPSPISAATTSTALTSTARPSGSSDASTRSAMTSCFAPKLQAEHHHEGAPLSYRAAGSNFRASHVLVNGIGASPNTVHIVM